MAHPTEPKSSQRSARLRVRSRRLDEIDDAKLAVALAMLARRLLAQRPETPGDANASAAARLGEEEAR
jgi:hypothetical protein